MTGLIIFTMLAGGFVVLDSHLLKGKAKRRRSVQAKRFERRMHLEAWLDGQLAHRKSQRQVRSERAKRGWNTRRAA